MNDIQKVRDLLIEYSIDNKFWFSKCLKGCKYMKISFNNGKTWTAPMKIPNNDILTRTWNRVKRLFVR